MLFNSLHRRALLRGVGALALSATVTPARSDIEVPEPLSTDLVHADRRTWNGRDCLALELNDNVQARLLQPGNGEQPAYAIVHRNFGDGSIEANLGAELTGKGGEGVRGFVGLTFHIGGDQTYEAVYLRMTNGRLNTPPPPAPRIDRAIQYMAAPDFRYAVSRAQFPGRYEKGADIAFGRWHRLRLDIRGAQLTTSVDGVEALTVHDLRYPGRIGAVGLWIGDGTRGLFRNLAVAGA